MCGIVGYVGKRQAQPILFECLSRLEYRGYDSSGIAVRGSGIRVAKDKLRVDALQAKSPPFHGTVGIGHTRWATHGIPSMCNAHPHTDCKGSTAVVHNGVISNYLKLKRQLLSEGHVFRSETDTEVIPHLIDKYYQGNMIGAVEAALSHLEGSYAIAVLAEAEDRLIVARKDSPLIIGVGNRENLIASDAPALMGYSDRIICLENGDVADITADDVTIRRNGQVVSRPLEAVHWKQEDTSKCGYEHFMLKEIREQPRVIQNILRTDLEPDIKKMFEGQNRHTIILACGTSYHAGLLGKHLLEDLLGYSVTVELASEFNYRDQVPEAGNAILITQSGETADVLAAMKKLRAVGIPILVITNVAHSTACRSADHSICTDAGPEISVAATKSFIAQLITLYRLALSMPGTDPAKRARLIELLRELPARVQRIIDNEGQIAECARYISNYSNIFFIGRGINFPVALEGALKLKEISYIHAEGCAAGELKHGPLALMGKNTPVVAVAAHDKTYDALITNVREVKARRSPVILVNSQHDMDAGLADRVITIDDVNPTLSPVLNAVALQLLAYHTARTRGCPIDFPRNLAKSVTVE